MNRELQELHRLYDKCEPVITWPVEAGIVLARCPTCRRVFCAWRTHYGALDPWGETTPQQAAKYLRSIRKTHVKRKGKVWRFDIKRKDFA